MREKSSNKATHKSNEAAIKLLEAFATNTRKSCNSSLDYSKKDWLRVYAPSSCQLGWIKKTKASCKGLPAEGKPIISLKKSFCDNLNRSITVDHESKMKELESELSTAVQSKNQLEDTIQILDKYFSELIKKRPSLMKIKEALDSVVIPIARLQNNNKEVIRSLHSQINDSNDENKQLKDTIKLQEYKIDQMRSKLRNQEELCVKLQRDSPDKSISKIPKLDLSKVKPKCIGYKQIIRLNKYNEESDEDRVVGQQMPPPNVSRVKSKWDESDDSAPAIPHLDLSLLHGQMQYQDEFMSKQDEFSVSWRKQLEKEKRY